MSVLTAEPGANLHELEPGFLATVEDFATRCAAHRYAVPIHVTSGHRSGDKGSHGSGGGIDVRGWGPAWEATADILALVRKRLPTLSAQEQREKARDCRYLQLCVWLAGMWVSTCRDHGYGPEEWAIGLYPITDRHLHLDVRPHVAPELYAAAWVGESG